MKIPLSAISCLLWIASAIAQSGSNNNDVGFSDEDILLPPATAQPKWIATDASEYDIQIGATVHNLGSDDQDSVWLNARVDHDGITIYDETSGPVAIQSGDNAFITLPNFNQPNYEGHYTLIYSAVLPTDEDMADNTYRAYFFIDSLYALTALDTVTHVPVVPIGHKPTVSNGDFTSCVHFRDPNASRLAVRGLYFSATKVPSGDMDGQLFYLEIYEWNDVFTGISDPDYDYNAIVNLASTEYLIDETTTWFEGYGELDDPVVLEDDQRYLFCATTPNQTVYFGYNDEISYTTTQQVYDQPLSPHRNGSVWFTGFVDNSVSTIAPRMIRMEDVGIAETEVMQLAPYPNPNEGIFHLNLAGFGPNTEITVTDVTGRVVFAQRTSAPEFHVDLRGEAGGVYAVDVRGAGAHGAARVVVR